MAVQRAHQHQHQAIGCRSSSSTFVVAAGLLPWVGPSQQQTRRRRRRENMWRRGLETEEQQQAQEVVVVDQKNNSNKKWWQRKKEQDDPIASSVAVKDDENVRKNEEEMSMYLVTESSGRKMTKTVAEEEASVVPDEVVDKDDDKDPSSRRSQLQQQSTDHHPQHHRHRRRWHPRPERGIVLKKMSHQDCYEAYRSIQQEYQAKAFCQINNSKQQQQLNDDDGCINWKILNCKHNVTVSILEHPDDPTCPYVKMEGIIPVPVSDCWTFLMVHNWDYSMPKMDPFYEGVSVHGEYMYTDHHHHTKKRTIRMILCRKRTKRILAFGKRDLVFLSCTQDEPLDDGTWVSGTVSVITDEIPRQPPSYTRAFQDSIAFYKPICNGTATNLTIVCRIDLNDSGPDGTGGYIPMWLYVQTIGRTAAASVYKMRQALIEEQAEKRKQMQQEEEQPQQRQQPELLPSVASTHSDSSMETANVSSSRSPSSSNRWWRRT